MDGSAETIESLAEVEIGLARGKELNGKRADIAEKNQERDVERALRERQKGQQGRFGGRC